MARLLRCLSLLALLAGAARGDTTIRGIPGECQLTVVECATGRDDATRPPPRIVSSVFMQDEWTVRGYEPSPDGQTLLVHLEDGIRLVRGRRKDDYALDLDPAHRAFQWHPDSKRVAFWVKATSRPGSLARLALAVLDVTALPPGPIRAGVPYDVVYWNSARSFPSGFAWSPDGQALLVLSTEYDPEDEQLYGTVTRAEVPSALRRVDQIVVVPGALDFMRCSAGPAGWLLYGHEDRLYVIDQRGRGLMRMPDVPSSTGLFDVEWSPSAGARARDRLLLFYRSEERSPSGRLFQGVYLCDLSAAFGPSPEPPESLHGGTDVHSLWFSPRGTYASWASQRGVWYRAPGAKPAGTVHVSIPSFVVDSDTPVIRGLAWSADETRLAIAAGNRLYIHEVATKALYPVAELGELADTFVAQPTWIGDHVVVSSYEDAIKSSRVISPERLYPGGRSGLEKDPTQGRGSSSAGGQPPPRKR